MLRFSANLSLLFTEYPLVERFAAAKRQGFEAVEIQFPYELSATHIQSLLDEHDLQLVLFNVDADNLLQGGEGLAAAPERQTRFHEAVEQAVAYADVLKPRAINVLPGRCLQPSRLDAYRQTLLANLHHAAERFAEIGVMTVFEAVNTHDMPGFIVDSGREMVSILEAVGHANLRLQYDLYHMSRMNEDCAAFLQTHLDEIGHIQFADCPGRGQPGTGNVDFEGLFTIIDDSDYAGWLGAEYKPQGEGAQHLSWLKHFTRPCR